MLCHKGVILALAEANGACWPLHTKSKHMSLTDTRVQTNTRRYREKRFCVIRGKLTHPLLPLRRWAADLATVPGNRGRIRQSLAGVLFGPFVFAPQWRARWPPQLRRGEPLRQQRRKYR